MRKIGEFFGGLIKRDKGQGGENAEVKNEPKGLDRYRLQLEWLQAEFEKSFDPNDRSKTEDIYRMAKRIKRMIHGPLFEAAYSGIFRSEGSGLGPAKGKDERRRVREQQNTAV